MRANAVVMKQPEHLVLAELELTDPTEEDVVVDVDYSGISTGTEKLLWTGRMPPFPGMGYPLVPGYESVGRIVEAGTRSGRTCGEQVFVPGARCFGEVRGLFGGAASRLVVGGQRAHPYAPELGEQGALLALAATAYHALSLASDGGSQLIVGHGVLGRLIARLAMLRTGTAPTVWETDEKRMLGSTGYRVVHPAQDDCRSYRTIIDASGNVGAIDGLVARLAHGGDIILAGFYAERVAFDFPPAFLREARFQIAAEWQEPDLSAVRNLTAERLLSLDGLISHRRPFREADSAYRTAFMDPDCLKMILDWRNHA